MTPDLRLADLIAASDHATRRYVIWLLAQDQKRADRDAKRDEGRDTWATAPFVPCPACGVTWELNDHYEFKVGDRVACHRCDVELEIDEEQVIREWTFVTAAEADERDKARRERWTARVAATREEKP